MKPKPSLLKLLLLLRHEVMRGRGGGGGGFLILEVLLLGPYVEDPTVLGLSQDPFVMKLSHG